MCFELCWGVAHKHESVFASLCPGMTQARVVFSAFCCPLPMDGDAGPRFAFGHLELEDGLEEDVRVADLVLTEHQTIPASNLRLPNAGGGGQPSVAGGTVGDRR